MEPIYFESPDEMRAWFEKNHRTSSELLVGYYKRSTGRKSVTWSESVDEALCFGWIDGRINSIDDSRYIRRFTPRKPNSVWSNVNIKKIKILKEQGKMKAEGLEAFSKKNDDKSGIYHFEKPAGILDAEFEKIFAENEIGWQFFNSQTPSYRRLMIHWIQSAKKQETQICRLHKVISASSSGKKL